MILLDTNVISEPIRPAPEPRVAEWLNAQPLETLFLSAITVAELRAGIAVLPNGKRRKALQEYTERQVLPAFVGRVLSFDLACTPVYAELVAKARAAGRSLSTADAYIAAIAANNGFIIATRDTQPFEAVGVAVVDPWNAV